MTLRRKSTLIVGVVSLVSAAVFSGSLLYLARSTTNVWENKKLERGIEIAVSGARDSTEQAEALSAFRAYRQLQVVKGLVDQRIIVAGLVFGLGVFLLSLAVTWFALGRVTRPLSELTAAIEKAGAGDLDVRVKAGPDTEVGAVASAFNLMAERLRRSRDQLGRAERLAAWRDVARLLSHEIRNPLTPIRLSVERLEQKSRERNPDLPGLVERSSRTILEEIDALDRIVTEFSDFARMPAPKLRRASLNRLITDVVHEYLPPGTRVEHELSLDPAGDEWRFDPDLMRRAFGNIVKNSVEALGARPGRVKAATSRQGDRLVVVFSDNGPGVPAEVRSRAFEPYVTTKARGTGLGLAFVRQVVAGHSGAVELNSGPEAGTTITITLPEGEAIEDKIAGS
jgi:nitrogen fixation/metabolism regulation signal transduction histidine kinase